MNSTLEVADRWFQVETLGDGIALIHEPHVDEFIRANIWHVQGRDRDLLIDTGLGVRPLRTEIPRLRERPGVCGHPLSLRSLGRSLRIRSEAGSSARGGSLCRTHRPYDAGGSIPLSAK